MSEQDFVEIAVEAYRIEPNWEMNPTNGFKNVHLFLKMRW